MANASESIERLTPGPRFSQGVVYGGLLYTAGQVDKESTDVTGQTKNVLAKIDALLAQAQSSKSQVLSALVTGASSGIGEATLGPIDVLITNGGGPKPVTFLCGDLASYITGQTIAIDGGYIKSLY